MAVQENERALRGRVAEVQRVGWMAGLSDEVSNKLVERADAASSSHGEMIKQHAQRVKKPQITLLGNLEGSIS